MVGQRFGMLVVLHKCEPTTTKSACSYVQCRCDCGKEKPVRASALRNGHTKSCGCLRKTGPVDRDFTKQDRVGERVGLLTIKSAYMVPGTRRREWLCQCDCGNTTILSQRMLRDGGTKSCGCQKHNQIDLTGRRFGRLVAVCLSGQRATSRRIWHCLCDCGNEHDVKSSVLLAGDTKSCGCLRNHKLASSMLKASQSATQRTQDRRPPRAVQ